MSTGIVVRRSRQPPFIKRLGCLAPSTFSVRARRVYTYSSTRANCGQPLFPTQLDCAHFVSTTSVSTACRLRTRLLLHISIVICLVTTHPDCPHFICAHSIIHIFVAALCFFYTQRLCTMSYTSRFNTTNPLHLFSDRSFVHVSLVDTTRTSISHGYGGTLKQFVHEPWFSRTILYFLHVILGFSKFLGVRRENLKITTLRCATEVRIGVHFKTKRVHRRSPTQS